MQKDIGESSCLLKDFKNFNVTLLVNLLEENVFTGGKCVNM